MSQIRSYEVTLRVTGPVKINNEIRFSASKELRIGEVFDSAIEIRPDPEGFHIIYTEDPYDRFFAYWLSIEVIANKFPTRYP